jgi:hypothetical protein
MMTQQVIFNLIKFSIQESYLTSVKKFVILDNNNTIKNN